MKGKTKLSTKLADRPVIKTEVYHPARAAIATKDSTALEILLRGKTYKAERFTDTAYVALGNLVRDKRRSSFPDLANEAEKQQLAELLLDRISDDEYIKRLCYWLIFIFPSLPDNLVWHNDPTKRPAYGMTLELSEIVQVVSDCAIALAAKERRS